MDLFPLLISVRLELISDHPVQGWSIIQHHTPLYLLSSNMDQCLAVTSAVTALPAVSVPTEEDGDGRSGLVMNPGRRAN